MSFNQNNCKLNSTIAGALVHLVGHLNWRIKQHEDRANPKASLEWLKRGTAAYKRNMRSALLQGTKIKT